jgi:hypothetical protein
MKLNQKHIPRMIIFGLVFLLAGVCFPLTGHATLREQYTREELTEVYSAQDTKFLQWFSDGYSFKTSIPNGQITPGMVSAEFPAELAFSLTYNGAPMAYTSGEYLFQPGDYVFTVLTPNGIYGEFAFTVSDPGAGPNASESAQTVVLTHTYTDGRFVYTFENGRSFSANVPNGGITNYGVTFEGDSELICVLTKNGSAMLYEPGSVLIEDGYYYMRIISPMVVEAPDLSRFEDDSDTGAIDLDALERELASYDFSDEGLSGLEVGDIFQTIFSFQIINKPTRDVPVFNVPPGFELSSLYCNGEPMPPSGTRQHRMDRDGDYVITLRDAVSAAPEQMVKLTVKMIPPAVFLEGVINQNSSSGPVTVHVPAGVTLTVYRNNMETSPAGVYSERGRYQVIAIDEAGNTARLAFEIVFALPRSLTLGIVLALLVAGVAYVLYARRSMVV